MDFEFPTIIDRPIREATLVSRIAQEIRRAENLLRELVVNEQIRIEFGDLFETRRRRKVKRVDTEMNNGLWFKSIVNE